MRSEFNFARSPKAAAAKVLVESLQGRFVSGLQSLCEQLCQHPESSQNDQSYFVPVNYYRDDGFHGGGTRFVANGGSLFNRASVNVSQVHYDDLAEKKLGSATAISTIIHPNNPLAPSIHIHISWTEMKDGSGYWRMMADLNPSCENPHDMAEFISVLKGVSASLYCEAAAQGDRYFFIPALKRHRGVSHFYLEGFNRGDDAADSNFALNFGEAVIDVYLAILQRSLQKNTKPSAEDFQRQLDYHTLYLFQVLTLDRGTTSGLLVHNQNDVGTLGSLPARINRSLLFRWREKVPSFQEKLLTNILFCLPEQSPCEIRDETKKQLATALRDFYKEHPEAIALQASGNKSPTTVDNHK